MNLQESIAQTIREFETSQTAISRQGMDRFENQYQRMLDQGLLEEPKYNLAPISTLPASVGCFITLQK